MENTTTVKKSPLSGEFPHTPSASASSAAAVDASSPQNRRSSSRSIKRKRFDDEIVEYSIGFPGSQLNRFGRARTQSQSFATTTGPSAASAAGTFQSPPVTQATAPLQTQSLPPPVPVEAAEQTTTKSPQLGPTPATVQSPFAVSLPAAPATVPTSVAIPTTPILTPIGQNPYPVPTLTATPNTSMLSGTGEQRRKAVKSTTGKKTKKAGRGANQVTTKDLGRWKPIDDLALIIGIQQTNDLRTVHRGMKFSCKFTLQELQSRWYALLYEEPISRIAVAAMRNLHPELVESVQSKALYAVAEEDLLGTIKSTESPIVEIFQELLEKNSSVFHQARTAKALLNHWQLMKQYFLLPDQTVKNFPSEDHAMNFSDAEDLLNDSELTDVKDEPLEIELSLVDRKNKGEIRQLENELGRWAVLVDSMTGVGIAPEFDNQTLAVLRGRLVRFLMRSKEITFGRSAKDVSVDVNLSLEGPAFKASRKQGIIKLRSNGDFFISNEGKRAIFIDGMPVLQGNKFRLNNNCVVEIAGLRFVFLVNYDLINAIRHESAKTTVPLN